MTQLLEQAFAAATKLSQDKQDELAQLISDFTDTSINHDAALAEYIFVTISSSQ